MAAAILGYAPLPRSPGGGDGRRAFVRIIYELLSPLIWGGEADLSAHAGAGRRGMELEKGAVRLGTVSPELCPWRKEGAHTSMELNIFIPPLVPQGSMEFAVAKQSTRRQRYGQDANITKLNNKQRN